MARNIIKAKEVDVATVKSNAVLAAGVGRPALERCKAAIVEVGVLNTPVVGVSGDGERVVLSGERELKSLRELGVKKMEAIEIEMSNGIGKAELSLRLLSLMDRPGALCEGQLIREAVGAGMPRTEVQAMLGKSASWVSNRLSLVTRLDGNVYGLVRDGLLEARSAQEISRLPGGQQFRFAEAMLREGLPKSAVEKLVAAYNDAGCPAAVRAEIINTPKTALKRLAGSPRAARAKQPGQQYGDRSPLCVIEGNIKSILLQILKLYHGMDAQPCKEGMKTRESLKKLEKVLAGLLAEIQGLFSPGKKGVLHG